MEGDDSSYTVRGFDPNIMVPDEPVYKPKTKEKTVKKGLESFMDDEPVDKVARRSID